MFAARSAAPPAVDRLRPLTNAARALRVGDLYRGAPTRAVRAGTAQSIAAVLRRAPGSPVLDSCTARCRRTRQLVRADLAVGAGDVDVGRRRPSRRWTRKSPHRFVVPYVPVTDWLRSVWQSSVTVEPSATVAPRRSPARARAGSDVQRHPGGVDGAGGGAGGPPGRRRYGTTQTGDECGGDGDAACRTPLRCIEEFPHIAEASEGIPPSMARRPAWGGVGRVCRADMSAGEGPGGGLRANVNSCRSRAKW